MILRIFCLLLFIYPTQCQVQVDVGGQAFISISQLLPAIDPAVSCAITLDHQSTNHLRAGKIKPRSFSCSTPDNLIRYVHDGNPYLRKDEINFIVYHYHEFQVVERKVQLHIEVLNNLKTIPFILASTSFTKLSWDAVKPRHETPHDARCVAKLEFEPTSQILYNSNRSPLNKTSFLCQELPRFLLKLPENDITYRYMKIQYEVDRGNSLPTCDNHIVLVRSSKHSLPNSPPQILPSYSKNLHMNQYSLLIIHPNIINVRDDSTPIESIIIKTVWRNTSMHDGFLVHVGDQWNSITSFKYGDLLRRRIAFRGPTMKLSHPTSRELCLVAVDLQFSESSILCFSIFIKPISIEEPKIVEKKDLVLLKGSSQIISTQQIGLVNSDEVMFQVKGGPYNGLIEIDGKSSISFNNSDIELGKVIYKHNGEWNFFDKIILKVSNSVGSTRLQIDIKIINTLDQVAPLIVRNESLNVSDLEIPLTSGNIDAVVSEMEEDNDELVFTLNTSPQHGVFINKPGPFSRGTIIESFTRKQIKNGLIYYQVTTKSPQQRIDSISLRVQHALIRNVNASTDVVLTISINPSSSSEQEIVIKKCPGTNSTATLTTTKAFRIFTANDFCYLVDDVLVNDTRYVITSPPHLQNDILSDAGAMVALQFHSNGELESMQDNLIDTFDQSMINNALVAYKTPLCQNYEKCLSTKTVEFKFAVTCPKCLTLYEQVFTLHFQTESKHPPSVLLIRLGETRLLNEYLKNAMENSSNETIVLLNNPGFGVLVRDGSVLKVNRSWTIKEFLSKNVWYQHSHQVCSKDEISFSVKYSIFRIYIVALTDSRSFSIEDLSPTSPAVLNYESFASKMFSLSNEKFEIIRQPIHGYIFVTGTDEDARDDFSLEELKSNSVNLRIFNNHHPLKDYFLVLHNMESSSYQEHRRGDCQLSLFNVSFTWTPERLDKLLVVSSKAINVNLVTRSSFITSQTLTVLSTETISDDRLTFVVVQSPAWGRIVKSSSNHVISEKTVTSFTETDIKSNLIRYSLGNIYGRTNLGNLMDSFHVYVTDGTNNSSVTQVLVNISMPTHVDNVVKKRNHRNVNKNISKKHSRKDEENHVATSFEFPSSFTSNIHHKDRKRNSLHLDVNNIRVNKKGQAPFTIFYEKSSHKRRSMTESILSLEVPPSYGSLVLMKPRIQQDNVDQVLKVKEEKFQNLSLTDISNEIRMIYRHDGSDSSFDNFVLSLSNDNVSIKKAVLVKVGSKSKIATELIKKHDLFITNQNPATLNSSILLAVSDSIDLDEIEFEVVTQPKSGYLKVLDQHLESSETPLEVGSFFTQQDVHENRVFYVPLDTTFSDDNFTFKINDDPRLHTLNIFVKHHVKILAPLRIVLGNQSHCLAEDSLDKLEKVDILCLFVSVKKKPLNGVVGQQGYKFSAADFGKGRVCYSGHESSKRDEFELSLVNECTNRTMVSRKFLVDPNELNAQTPHLDVSIPLMVIHGDRVSLTSANLRASIDGVDASRIYFVVVDPPRHGRLLMDGMPVEEFSQEDINNELISYESSRIDDSMMDYFLFFISTDKIIPRNASDGKASFFSILIQPASKVPPKLTVVSPHRNVVILDNKFVFRIDPSRLKASHSSFSNRELVYHIKNKAKHGYLELLSSGRQVRRRFTQKDVDDGKLIFVIRNDSLATNDSFTFKLVDPNKNTIDNQRFSLEWSVVEFPSSHLKICKNSDILIVPVIRRGLTSETSSVQIKAKYLMEKEIHEHSKQSNGSITFLASSSKEDWMLRMAGDSARRNGIKLKLSLFDVKHGVLGAKDKAIVHILDSKTACSNKSVTSVQEAPLKLENLYEDKDYEDENNNEKDDYLESDLSYYSDKMMINEKGERKDFQQMPSIPQPCNPTTKSLLFLDVSSSQLFKCNGKYWEKWGWTSNTSGFTHPERKETLEEKSQKTCPLGWLLYGDNCFLSSKVKMTWTEAEEICRRDGGHLAFVLSIDHLAWLSSLTDGSKFWIGLNNRRDVSQWEYTGSALFSSIDLSRNIFYNWEAHQPCSKCPRSRCVQVSEELHYSNKQCTMSRARFVCARPSRLLRSSRRAKNRWGRTGRHHRTK